MHGAGGQWEAGKGSLPFERGRSYEFYTSGAVTQTLHTGSVLIQRLLLSI